MTQQDAYQILNKFATMMEEFFEDSIIISTYKNEEGKREIASVDFGEDIIKDGMLKWLQDEILTDKIADKVEDAYVFNEMCRCDDEDDEPEDFGDDWKKNLKK